MYHFFSSIFPCDTIPGKTWTTAQGEQTKVKTSKSSLGNQRVLIGLLTGVWVRCSSRNKKMTHTAASLKAHPSLSDSSQKMGTWSSLPSLQATHMLLLGFILVGLSLPQLPLLFILSVWRVRSGTLATSWGSWAVCFLSLQRVSFRLPWVFRAYWVWASQKVAVHECAR